MFDPPICLNLTATDPAGKSDYDEFEIEVEPSTSYIFEKLGYYGSPLVGILGLIKYRDELHAILCRNKYQYKRVE